MGPRRRPIAQAQSLKCQLSGKGPLGYNIFCALDLFGAGVFGTLSGGTTMEWTTPQHEVVDLNCEVSSYANAEL